MELTANEKKYTEKWVKDLQTNENFNVYNHRDSMLPVQHTTLSIGEGMSAEDIFTVN